VGGRGQKGLAQVGSAARAAMGELPGNTARRETDIFVAPQSEFTTEARRTRRRKKWGNQENWMTGFPDFVFLLVSLFFFSFFFLFFLSFLFFSVFSVLPW
jgi:hypothetical protein